MKHGVPLVRLQGLGSVTPKEPDGSEPAKKGLREHVPRAVERGTLSPGAAAALAEHVRRKRAKGMCPSGDHPWRDCDTPQECKEASILLDKVARGEVLL